MKPKTKKLLEILDSQIQMCEECNLFENGRAKPYWTEESKYMMILEAPGKEEVDGNVPLVGKTGRIFWDIISEYQLKREYFLIINSVNCRVVFNKRNGKPSEYHRNCCRPWIRKSIKIFQPQKLILFGNYACHTILGEWGISKLNSLTTEEEVFGLKTEVIRSYHPSSLIYNKKEREKDLRETIKKI